MRIDNDRTKPSRETKSYTTIHQTKKVEIKFVSNELKDKRLAEHLHELATIVKQSVVGGVASREVELPLFRGVMEMPQRPRPQHKLTYARLDDEPGPEAVNGQAATLGWLAESIEVD